MYSIDNKEYLTQEEVESEFHLSMNLQKRLRIRSDRDYGDKLPYFKIGKTILYKRSDLIEFIEKKRR
ncbi:hypothetical protein [Campylobacter hyointestinalis]|uniref:hypothetical protein n=1 Tax=Campylobacter hyointestinalis TaxID=198 RepID=UPI002552E431|nr:hypothetical protein [Campylobacter hyointestinalis]MDL2347038.1 hypothetical protein [Campylobacter hyointestinalis]MDL2348348.1 hypothetical protein [Campylobacter hyointestinalis]MDL2350525.1 hypothetical protein [Campylobacter hyointestinalis]MDM1025926.1 hypothetical protein [Campylobacter hyointestinalis]MDM1027102.1 hypothetical protein [Campylobacter hyointestinalis]